jgi:hypothetical protein
VQVLLLSTIWSSNADGQLNLFLLFWNMCITIPLSEKDVSLGVEGIRISNPKKRISTEQESCVGDFIVE